MLFVAGQTCCRGPREPGSKQGGRDQRVTHPLGVSTSLVGAEREWECRPGVVRDCDGVAPTGEPTME